MNTVLRINIVVALQSQGMASPNMGILHDGARWNLQTQIAEIIPVPAAIVELYAPESTPQNPVLSRTAQAELDEAIVKLLTKGTPFFTVFRKNWNAPVIHWHGATSA